MKFNLFLHVYTFLSLALARSYAVVTPDAYWKSVLPNSHMPKAIKDLLYTAEWTEEKNTQPGVHPRLEYAASEDQLNNGRIFLYKYAASEDQLNDGRIFLYKNAASEDQLNDGRIFLYKNAASEDQLNDGRIFLYKYAASEDQLNNGRIFLYKYAASEDQLNDGRIFLYKNAASEDQLNYNPNVALFFLENKLHQGIEMNLDFTKQTSRNATFLPRKVADSIPFSSNKLPEIFNEFSIKPDSTEAEVMKQTLNACEDKGIEGEEKYCATSLESMVDFSTTKLGTKVKAISTEANAKGSASLQKYTIEGAKKLAADKAVVCHKQNYAYAVFYCHKTVSTRAYAVSLTGEDGTKAKAVAVCHTDTAKWNPKHLAFQVLKVKPGSVPICHFFSEDHVVWVPY